LNEDSGLGPCPHFISRPRTVYVPSQAKNALPSTWQRSMRMSGSDAGQRPRTQVAITRQERSEEPARCHRLQTPRCPCAMATAEIDAPRWPYAHRSPAFSDKSHRAGARLTPRLALQMALRSFAPRDWVTCASLQDDGVIARASRFVCEPTRQPSMTA